MVKRENMIRRDFGGSGKKDWFYLHEDIDPQQGLPPTEAKRLASFLRIIGNAVKLDPLGGKGRLGVYYRKEKGKQHVHIGTIPKGMFKEWFREHTGTEREPFYECTVSNFISQNPHLICGNDNGPFYIWREQEFHDSTKGGTARVDVIIETVNDLWVIEVKNTSTFVGAIGPLRNAVKKVIEYGNKIQKLGWWKNKTMKLAVVWGTSDDVPAYSTSFYKNNELPLTNSEDDEFS